MSSNYTTDLERWVSPGSSLEIFQKSPPYPPLRGLDSVVTLAAAARASAVCRSVECLPHCLSLPHQERK
jgi:hypothetical protein